MSVKRKHPQEKNMTWKLRPRASVNGVRDKFDFLCPSLCPAKTAQQKANWWDTIPSFQPFRWITSNWKEPQSTTQDTHPKIPNHPSKPLSVYEEMTDLQQGGASKAKGGCHRRPRAFGHSEQVTQTASRSAGLQLWSYWCCQRVQNKPEMGAFRCFRLSVRGGCCYVI